MQSTFVGLFTKAASETLRILPYQVSQQAVGDETYLKIYCGKLKNELKTYLNECGFQCFRIYFDDDKVFEDARKSANIFMSPYTVILPATEDLAPWASTTKLLKRWADREHKRIVQLSTATTPEDLMNVFRIHNTYGRDRYGEWKKDFRTKISWEVPSKILEAERNKTFNEYVEDFLKKKILNPEEKNLVTQKIIPLWNNLKFLLHSYRYVLFIR